MSELPLVRSYIKTINLEEDIFNDTSLIEAIEKLMIVYSELLTLDYIRFEYVYVDDGWSDSDLILEIYGYKEESEKNILAKNKSIREKHEKDYSEYLRLKEQFEK